MERKEKARALPGYGMDGSDRSAIVDTATGELMDDADGCGWKSARKAYAGWGWKKEERKRRAEESGKKKLVPAWVEDNGILRMLLDTELRIKRLKLDGRMDGAFFAALLESLGTGIDLLPFGMEDPSDGGREKRSFRGTIKSKLQESALQGGNNHLIGSFGCFRTYPVFSLRGCSALRRTLPEAILH